MFYTIISHTVHTYRYIQIHTIQTYTYKYIHIHTHTYNQQSVSRGVWCCSGGCTRFTCQCAKPPIQVISEGARGGLAKCEMRWNVYSLRRGCTLDPPTRAARAGAPKRVRGVGLRWRENVVGHLSSLRGALSGARGVPPQRGVFWKCCAGIRACLGQYIPYIQHTCAYIQYMQYMHIWIEKIHTRYMQYTHMHSVLASANMRIHTIHTIHEHMD
jgi:hypothetical protein